MRYEWGLAVGHTYTHCDAVGANLEIISRSKKHDAWGPVQSEGGRDGENGVDARANGARGGNGKGASGSPEEDGVRGPEDDSEGEGEDDNEGDEDGEGEDSDEDGEYSDADQYNGKEYDPEADEGCRFSKGYESEEEREYLVFGEGRAW